MAFGVSGAKFLVLFLLFATGESAVAYGTSRGVNVTEQFPKKWVTELFREAEIDFQIASTASTKCYQDFATYREHLQNQSEWAVRMAESSEWPTVGLLAGTMNHLGNWVECTTATSQKSINGQYCFVSATYEFTRDFSDNLPIFQSKDVESSAWSLLQEYQKQPWKSNRQVVKWGICVPSSCQGKDIQDSLQKTLKPLFHRQSLDISVLIDPNACSKSSRENWWKDYEAGNNLFWIFTKSVVALTALSTMYHYLINTEDEKKSEASSLRNEIMTSFSIIRNYKDLTVVTPHDIPSVYFAKIIFMFLIVLGHRIIFFYSYPFFNSDAIEKELYSDGSMLIGLFYCGFIMVEAFFMFSGFVSFTAHLAKTKVKGWFAVVEDLLYRWAKMIPLQMYMLVILTYVMPTLNDGPSWYRTMNEAERCKSSLWSNFFAVSNIFGTEKMCMFHSWYPSVDIQLTIIGSIILVLYAKNEKLGTYVTFFVFAAGTAYTFIHTYINKYHGVMPIFVSTFYTGRNSEEFLNSYISTSTRISSYIVGFGFGIVTKKLAEMKFKFTEGNIFVIFVLDLCSKAVIICYIPQLCESTKPYNQMENAISAAIIRSLFVLPEALICCAYAGTRKCKYLLFFDNTVWVPLGRLLYGVFVVSVVLQYYHSVSHQVLIPSYSLIYIFWLFIGDIIYSIAGAFILFLMVQAPIFNLLKIFIRQSTRKLYSSLRAAKLPTNDTKQSQNEIKHKKL